MGNLYFRKCFVLFLSVLSFLMLAPASTILAVADDNPAQITMLMPNSFTISQNDYLYNFDVYCIIHNDIANTISMPGIPTSIPSTYNDFRAMLQGLAPQLTTAGKMEMLGWIGAHLLQGYDDSEPPYAVPMEQLYQNMLTDGNKGGVCKDIHTALLQLAHDLGFQNLEGQGSSANEGPHGYAMIQNPDNQHWYLLNYYYFVDTGTSEYYKAADLASRHMGQLSTIEIFSPSGNNNHLIQDRPTQWAAQLLNTISQFDPKPSAHLHFEAGAELTFNGQTVSLQYEGKILKVYAIESSYASREKVYDMNAVGVAGNLKGETPLLGAIHVGIDTQGTAGLLNFSSPDIIETPGTSTSSNNLFAIGKLRAWLGSDNIRIFGTTDWENIDYRKAGNSFIYSAPYNEAQVGVELGILQRKLLLEAGRTLQMTATSLTDNLGAYATKEDYLKGKFNFAIDLNDKTKLYIVSETTFYVFDGLDKKSAMGVMELIKASIPSENLGTFTIIADASALFNQTIQGNGLPDPFFQQDHPFVGLTAEWKKEIWTDTTLGAQVRAVSGVEPHPVFHDNLFATPELYQMDAPNTLSLQGKVFISRKF